jgi:hypothetical protein
MSNKILYTVTATAAAARTPAATVANKSSSGYRLILL